MLEEENKRKIGVVGTGVAGLTAAHLLSAEYEVTIFESADTLGMDSASVTYAGARMDVPLRTFSGDYYPNLTSLYEKIGVEFEQANYEFSCFRNQDEEYFSFFNFCNNPILDHLFGLKKVSLPRFLSWNPLKMLRYFELIIEFYLFQRRGPSDLENGNCENKTFKQYVLERYSKQLYYELLLPMLSVICTCSWEAVDNYPAEILVDYLTGRARLHPLGSSTYRATSGTIATVKKLSANCSRILTSCTVTQVMTAKDDHRPRISWYNKKSRKNETEEFDYVVIATQANSALNFLEGDDDQKIALASVKYEKSRTILHTDDSMISKNFTGTCALQTREGVESDCTIWMNHIDAMLEKSLTENVFQTWNPLKEPKIKPIIDVIFERPVLTLESQEGLDLLAKVNGRGGIWFVGAYSLYSMPLLENGVRSAIRVANRLMTTKYPELGVQVSGESFAKRRPDLATIKIDHKRSANALALDSIVFSSVAIILGTASFLILPLISKGFRR